MQKDTLELSRFNIDPFNGENFGVWKWKMEAYFDANGLLDIIKGKREANEDELRKIKWILAQTIDNSQIVHIMNKDTPLEMWLQLESIHERSSADAIQKANEDFYTIMPSENGMADFISKINNVVRRLKDFNVDLPESIVIANILSKLPVEYNTFKVAWDCTPISERNMMNLTSRLLKEEENLKKYTCFNPNPKYGNQNYQRKKYCQKKNSKFNKNGQNFTAKAENN